ncbi:MAG TPA: response regulator [Gemmatimonas sp.]|uniref:response regulator n=1 Tax=Gemmatimonas sp. TaxID=1962908 RepID=UPI002ED8897A
MSHHILAVEDSPTQAEILRHLLESAGHDVTVAVSGEAALELLASTQRRFDVVVSDIVMPGAVDGYELCRRIKASPHYRTPVVLLTSLSDPMDIIKGLECGADNFFTKPYDGAHLLERIMWLLDTRRARRRGAVHVGLQVYFMGREFTISSEREQILDLLISTFEDAVRQNHSLRQREAELESARAELARYAGVLETDIERFFELSTDLICLAGTDGYFSRLNPAWEHLLGWSDAELKARPYIDFVHPDDRDAGQASLFQPGEGRGTMQFENRYRCRDGSYRWLEWRAIPSPDDDVVFAIARDVTQRREAERILRVRFQQQAAVAALGQAAVEMSDLEALFDAAVFMVAETLDVPMAQVLELTGNGKRIEARASVGYPRDAKAIAMSTGPHSLAGYTLQQNAPTILVNATTETRFEIGADAEANKLLSAAAVIVPLHGRPYGVLEVGATDSRAFGQDDIHFLQSVAHILGSAIDRRRADHALQQSQRMESVGRLAGGIAHDFNNLLTVILAHNQFVAAALPDDDTLKHDLAQVDSAATRAASLTRQLLAFSRRQVLAPKVLSLNDTVVDIERMLRRVLGDDVSLQVLLDETLHPVLADPGQIEQVVMNLAVNARDAMATGGTLSIKTSNEDIDAIFAAQHEGASLGPHAVISVSDTGSGMDRETQARIFEPFFTTKGPDRGTGLGLATVYGIVTQSRGTIGVYSELGRGSTFKVYLPRAQHAEVVQTPVAGRVIAPTGGAETILLAEDEDGVRHIAARLLRSFGYTVLEASNGEQALAIGTAHVGHIDLLVSDVTMPRMGGGALARELTAIRPELKVLHLSGHVDPGVIESGLFTGNAAFLQKPFSAETLSRKVREVLDAPQ